MTSTGRWGRADLGARAGKAYLAAPEPTSWLADLDHGWHHPPDKPIPPQVHGIHPSGGVPPVDTQSLSTDAAEPVLLERQQEPERAYAQERRRQGEGPAGTAQMIGQPNSSGPPAPEPATTAALLADLSRMIAADIAARQKDEEAKDAESGNHAARDGEMFPDGATLRPSILDHGMDHPPQQAPAPTAVPETLPDFAYHAPRSVRAFPVGGIAVGLAIVVGFGSGLAAAWQMRTMRAEPPVAALPDPHDESRPIPLPMLALPLPAGASALRFAKADLTTGSLASAPQSNSDTEARPQPAPSRTLNAERNETTDALRGTSVSADDFGDLALAAAAGDPAAQFRLGERYESGIGVARDIAFARLWYTRAAAQKHPGAMYGEAILSMQGGAAKPDFAKALALFREAGALGHRDSQFNAGVLLARGVGGRQDLPAAYAFFDLAARAGDTDAVAKRDEIAKGLDAAGLAKARQMVETLSAGTTGDEPEALSGLRLRQTTLP